MSFKIDRQQLINHIKQDSSLVLVEALPANHFEREHLPGAINLPPNEITDKAFDVLPNKQATIVIYCSNTSCNNSSIGGNLLRQLGYTNVYEYSGGKQDWRDAGLDLEGVALNVH